MFGICLRPPAKLARRSSSSTKSIPSAARTAPAAKLRSRGGNRNAWPRFGRHRAVAGRGAEKTIFGEVSNGAESDLQQATSLARRMVNRWSMSDKLGPVAYHREQDHPFLGREISQPPDFSEDTARVIDGEVRSLIRGLEQEAEQGLGKHRAKLEAVAHELVEHEIMEAAEIRRLLNSHGLEVTRKHCAVEWSSVRV